MNYIDFKTRLKNNNRFLHEFAGVYINVIKKYMVIIAASLTMFILSVTPILYAIITFGLSKNVFIY